MTAKANRPSEPQPTLDVAADERHSADVEGIIARDREALNASIRNSREEIERGVQAGRTIGNIIADGRRLHVKH
jgi:hypothetical protein